MTCSSSEYVFNIFCTLVLKSTTMKKYMSLILLISGLLFLSGDILAQGKGHGKGNGNKEKGKGNAEGFGEKEKGHGPPPWAPAHGYRRRHIYFPDQKVYYDNTKGVYISMTNGKWEVSAEIPIALKGVDLKVAAKVELDLDNMDNPQSKFEEHLKLYPPKK